MIPFATSKYVRHSFGGRPQLIEIAEVENPFPPTDSVVCLTSHYISVRTDDGMSGMPPNKTSININSLNDNLVSFVILS